MKTVSAILIAALLLAPASDRPEFAVAEGSVVEKRFVETTTWTLDDMRQTMDGDEISFGQQPDMSAKIERRLVVVDEHGPTVDGRPQRLTRTVSAAGLDAKSSLDVEGSSTQYSVVLASPFVDEELRFAWNAERESYDVELASEREIDGLDELREDLDLRALLPPDDVEVGGEWTLDGAAVAGLFAAGGRWPLRIESVSEVPAFGIGVEDVVMGSTTTLGSSWSERDGELVATWTETREIDGRRVAVIALDLELELASENFAEQIVAWLEPTDQASERLELSYDARWRLAGEGRLEWDLAAGRFASLRLELEGRLDVDSTWTEDFLGTEIETEILAGLDTRSTFEATATAE